MKEADSSSDEEDATVDYV
ncbi:hypothetical protein CSPAE12_02643 [Colletotrichum incanum]|nr:hypothetical protein CSPAE12_02643 [Colletotrichum incanum]